MKYKTLKILGGYLFIEGLMIYIKSIRKICGDDNTTHITYKNGDIEIYNGIDSDMVMDIIVQYEQYGFVNYKN